MLSEPVAVMLEVINAVEALGIPYFLGGSMAAAVYGIVRSTADADLVADLSLEHASPLSSALAGEFYVDVDSIRDAVRQRNSFNVIHLDSAFKVDVFVPKGRPFDREQFARRSRQVVATHPERTAYVASAEDTVLAKLEWYRLGAEASERQWRDVLGVLRVQGDQLDQDYLRQWAAELGVAELLGWARRSLSTEGGG
jgi:hypothetical protein